jgi:hypothetical protein
MRCLVPGIIAASTKRRNGDPLSPRNRAKSRTFVGSNPTPLCLSGLRVITESVINIFIRSCPNPPLWPLHRQVGLAVMASSAAPAGSGSPGPLLSQLLIPLAARGIGRKGRRRRGGSELSQLAPHGQIPGPANPQATKGIANCGAHRGVGSRMRGARRIVSRQRAFWRVC